MKKILILALMFIMIPVMCFAADPVIRSDTRTFNPLKGIYNLQGNVFVQFPAHNTLLTITGDETQVFLYALEVHGKGNITLSYDDLSFYCDKVDVYHSDNTAYVEGNLRFTHNGTNIAADKGSFNWKTKQAAFSGNVKVNGASQKGDVIYNVMEKKFI